MATFQDKTKAAAKIVDQFVAAKFNQADASHVLDLVRQELAAQANAEGVEQYDGAERGPMPVA